MEVDNKKNVEEKRNGRVEKGLTEEQGWGGGNNRERVISNVYGYKFSL